ncbi:hypothetical protein KO489_00630 [Reinekea forsetii]|nr:hypothetical protein [Reinekea forsetii]
MKNLDKSQANLINGGLLHNGGYSGHKGWSTSAIKADPKKQKKGEKYVTCAGTAFIAAASTAGSGGLAVGTAAAVTAVVCL